MEDEFLRFVRDSDMGRSYRATISLGVFYFIYFVLNMLGLKYDRLKKVCVRVTCVLSTAGCGYVTDNKLFR